MNKKFIITYSIFASLAFAFALAFLGYNIYTEYTYGSGQCSTRFSNLATTLKTSADQDEKTFYDSLNKLSANTQDYAFLEIKKGKSVVFSYPDGYTKEETSSRLSKDFNSYFTSKIGKIYISANVYLIKPSSVYYYARFSFFIILIITLLTIILIIISNIRDKDESVEQKVSETESDEALPDDGSESGEVLTGEVLSNEIVSDDAAAAENESSEDELNDEQEVSSEADDMEEVPVPVKKASLPYEEYKPVDLTDEDAAPQGLFNPATGLSWESYLKTRLESEISRAVSSEFDLSLFVIRIPQLDRTSETGRNIINYLTIQFQFKDLLFEYKNDCIVCLKIGMNLDEALILSEKLHADLKNLISDKDCFIGISTRSIRMVSGERLLLEADQALVHAQEDKDSPVIAFRVDAQKYRNFMEHNN